MGNNTYITGVGTGYAYALDATGNLKLTQTKPMTTYVAPLAESLLDADTILLIKAGYLHDNLVPTEKFHEFMRPRLFAAHKADMVAAAKAELEKKD